MSVYSPANARFTIGAAPPIAVEEILLASRDLGDGTRQTDLSVPGMHCGGCMAAVEKTLAALDGVASARVNLSTKRVAVRWDSHGGAPPDLIGALARRGYPAHLFSLENDAKDPELSRLLKALAVAGFCAMNTRGPPSRPRGCSPPCCIRPHRGRRSASHPARAGGRAGRRATYRPAGS